MKVIDLLNKIANKEIEIGQKFNWHYRFGDIELIYKERQGAIGLYFVGREKTNVEDAELVGLFERYNYQILNDEVAIIEEQPTISHLPTQEGDWDVNLRLTRIEDKIKELIDVVNKMK